MLKIHKNISAAISQALCVIVFIVLTGLAIYLPWLLSAALLFFGKDAGLYRPSLIILYLSVPPAYAADLSLFLLLHHIRHGRVFTDTNVALMRLISWCCFAEAAIYAVFGIWYLTALMVAFVFVFGGMVVRVLKNVLEEATALKLENDYTI